MSLGGFAGNVLRVNLSERKIDSEPLDPGQAKKFIGGFGLCVKLAADSLPPHVDALAPENTVVLGVGPLVGTGVPAASRVYAITKLPATGTIGWCGGGGMNFGSLMKYAGFDHVVISGKAERPTYLEINDDNVRLRDADDWWGLGVDGTYDAAQEKYGPHTGVISIGQAAEQLVSFSMAYIDRISTLGRGGLGAVLGSKNLKAVVVRGNGGIKVAHRKRYRKLVNGILERIGNYPQLNEWHDLGQLKSMPAAPADVYHRMKQRRMACVSCPIGDKDVVRIPDGEFAGLVKYTSSALNLFYPRMFGLDDYWQSTKLVSLLDDLGIDVFEFCAVMSGARDLAQAGVIPAELVQPPVELTDLASLETWALKICDGEGLGSVLAKGLDGLVREYGDSAKKYLPNMIKGMAPYVGPGALMPWNLMGTMELGQALDPRGPHVGAGGSPTYFARRPLEVFPRHLNRMGVSEEIIERLIKGLDGPEDGQEIKIGALLKYSHRWFTILGSLGLCARAQMNRFYNAELCAELYEAVTGVRTDLADLNRRAERVWTLLRQTNVQQGLDRAKDALPPRWFKESGFKNYVTGEPQQFEEAEAMIMDYYREWGWDAKTGVPGQSILEQLGLK